MLSRAIENAQKAIEGRNFAIRKRTLQYDEVMNEQRKTIYGERLKVLKGEDVHEQMLKYIPDYIEKVVGETVKHRGHARKVDDEDALNEALKTRVYPDECTFTVTRDMLERWDYQKAINKISKEVIAAYEQKIVNIKNETHGQVDYHQIERNELLRFGRQELDRPYRRDGSAPQGHRPARLCPAGSRNSLQAGRLRDVHRHDRPRADDHHLPSAQGQDSARPPRPAARQARTRGAPRGAPRRRPPPKTRRKFPKRPKATRRPQLSPLPRPVRHPPAPVNMQAASAGGLAMRPQEFTPNPVGPQAPLVRGKKKEPGRNDPCPCGSGKKYKGLLLLEGSQIIRPNSCGIYAALSR